MMDFNLRSLRESLGMTLGEFARKCGITTAYASDIEYWRRFPAAAVRAKIVVALSLTDNELDAWHEKMGQIPADIEAIARQPQMWAAIRKLK